MNQDPLTPLPAAGTMGPGMMPPGLPSSGPAGQFNQINPFRLLRQHVRLLFVTILVGVVVGVGLWALLLRTSPRFSSKAQLVVTGGITEPYQGPVDAAAINQQLDRIEAFIKNEIDRLTSDVVLRQALQPDRVRNTQWYQQFNGDNREALDALKDALTATSPRGSTLIDIYLYGSQPADIPVVLNEVISVYLRTVKLDSDLRSDQLRVDLDREREGASRLVQQITQKLKNFADEHGLTSGDIRDLGNEAQVEFKARSERMAEIRLELQVAQSMFESLQQAQASGEIIASPEDLAMVDLDPGIQKRNEQLRSLWEERQVLLHRFGENHRAVQQLDQFTAAIEQKKREEVNRLLRERQAIKLDQASSAVAAYQGQLAAMEPELQIARERMRDMMDKIQQYRVIMTERDAAIERQQRAELALNNLRVTSNRSDNTRVEERFKATEAELVFPQVPIVVGGVTMLLLLAVGGVIVLRELLDQRIKTPADLKLVQGARLIGVVPHASEDPSGPSDLEHAVIRDPRSLLAEAFRQVRTDFINAMDKASLRSAVFVGAQPEAGVSAIVQNLAASLALQGRRVLVIDANLRRPAQHRLFSVAQQPGLAEVLAGKVSADEAISATSVERLHLMPAGQVVDVHPELLENKAATTLMQELRQRYDLVLIDTPPAVLTGDAMVIAHWADAVTIVSRAVRDKRGTIGRLLGQFRSQRALVLGVVLNGVKSSAGGYFRENYEAFYRYRQDTPKPQLAAN